MKVQHRVAIWCGSLLFLGTLMAGFLAANAQQGKNNKYICAETNPGACVLLQLHAVPLLRPASWTSSEEEVRLQRPRPIFRTLKGMRHSA
jgi:hypothetical protein